MVDYVGFCVALAIVLQLGLQKLATTSVRSVGFRYTLPGILNTNGAWGVAFPSPQMVKDKIILCRQMLPESAGVGKDEALSEVVGFLEACRPRMVDLIEAGIGGGLGEDTFAKCLQVRCPIHSSSNGGIDAVQYNVIRYKYVLPVYQIAI